MEIEIENECHPKLQNPDVCSSDEIILKLGDILKDNNTSLDLSSPLLNDTKIAIIDALKEQTNCDSESCIYTDSLVKSKLGKSAEIELRTQFKPPGPFDTTNWLDNFNIDKVLRQYIPVYSDYYPIKYQMIDFDEKKTELATINLPAKIKKGCKRFSVVFNTDASDGKGKHWFAMFMDFTEDPYTLEYFNSSGNLPVYQIRKWQLKTKKLLERTMNVKVECIIVSPNEIQKSDSECGVFCLWFILSRLEGYPVTTFKNINMGPDDDRMIKFRRALFRHSSVE